jgi:hypothetical protein
MFVAMVFKATSTERLKSRFCAAGWTIPETLMSIGITGMLMVVIVAMTMTSGRAFVALSNYVDLDAANQVAMDTLTRDVRECNRVTACSNTAINLEDSDGSTISYAYNSGAETFTRTKNGVSKVLLTKCSTMVIGIEQRKPLTSSFLDGYDAATPATAKVVNVFWNCYRTIFGARANTESVQTARIVIRKQG